MSFDFDAALDAAVERKTNDPDSASAQIVLGGKPVTLKFTEMPGREWAQCTLVALPREGNIVDATFGFNVNVASELAAPLSGVRVDGEENKELTPAQWSKLFQGVDARGRQAIVDAVIAANESAHIGRLNAAKKALEDASKPKPSSPAN